MREAASRATMIHRPVGARRFAAALVVAVALAAGSAALPCAADPTDEDDPSLSDVDYLSGRASIDLKRWADAVRSLKRAEVRFPDNADLHNHLGYAYRNLGQFDAAFRHYERALALNPRHRGAHEYIGEAYLLVDDVPNAQKHLAALREICLLPCEELDDLQKAFTAYQARKAAR
jgi:Flp pilus assembly protein TadD